MPYVTTIERMGIEQGLQQGLQQGSCRQLLRILRGRFGEAAEELREEITKLNVEQIDAVTDKAIAAQSLEEVIAALPQNEKAE